MAGKEYTDIIRQMKEQGILFLEGVSDGQLDQVQERYDIVFPEQLRQFYRLGMPVSAGFINWLDDSSVNVKQIKRKMRAPVRGFLAAVELEEIWPRAWGERPFSEEQALSIAGERLNRAAGLIPLYSHRYMACLENSGDSPVLSVYGGDIIYYGSNLSNWLQIEFCGLPHKTIFESELPEIPGWQELLG